MKKETILLLILIFSTGWFVPISEQEQSVTVLEDKQLQFIYNVHSPKIKLESDITIAIISVTISKINPSSGEESLVKTKEFTKSTEIDELDPGIYSFRFLSDTLVEITVSGKGVYQSVMVIFILLLVVNAILIYRRYMD